MPLSLVREGGRGWKLFFGFKCRSLKGPARQEPTTTISPFPSLSNLHGECHAGVQLAEGEGGGDEGRHKLREVGERRGAAAQGGEVRHCSLGQLEGKRKRASTARSIRIGRRRATPAGKVVPLALAVKG